MEHVIGGVLLVIVGCFLGLVTYKKYSFFWDFINARLLRRWLGDSTASGLLYVIAVVLIAVGAAVAVGRIA